MERRFVMGIGVLACLLMMTLVANPVWAGSTQSGFEPPPAGATITGPEIWGVFTIYCGTTSNFATLRLKRVDDCNAETLTFVDPAWDASFCPVTEEGILQFGLGVIQDRLESEWGITGNPYIDKIKNLDQQVDSGTGAQITSFDGMIKFWIQ